MIQIKDMLFIEKSRLVIEDIILLYRNFIHWNISKLIIALWGFVLGMIMSIPFFVVVLILASIDPIDWTQILGYLGF